MHYCVIARDSQMFVFENFSEEMNKSQQLRFECQQLIAMREKDSQHLIAKMVNIDTEDPTEESVEWTESITRGITASFHLMLSEGVWFGLVTDTHYDRVKAFDLLQDIR